MVKTTNDLGTSCLWFQFLIWICQTDALLTNNWTPSWLSEPDPTTNSTPSANNADLCSGGAILAVPSDERCAYVQSNCTDTNSLLMNPVLFHWCTMKGKPTVSILILIVMIGLYLYLLGSTAEGFFCPSLEGLTETLHISPNLAGVTFLAFGNGAPDVFSNVAAFSSGTATLGLAGLLGAGIFVTLAVVSAVAFASTPTLDCSAFVRDVLFYLCAVSVLMVFYIDSKITVFEAVTFPLCYVMYVMVVVMNGRCSCCKRQRPKISHYQLQEHQFQEPTVLSGFQTPLLLNDTDEDHDGEHMPQDEPDKLSKTLAAFTDFNLTGGYMAERAHIMGDHHAAHPASRKLHLSTVSSTRGVVTNESGGREVSDSINTNISAHHKPEEIFKPTVSSWSQYINLKIAKQCEDWSKLSVLGRVKKCISSPFYLLRLLTIPRPTEEYWDRPIICTCVSLAPVFCIWTTGNGEVTIGGFPGWSMMIVAGLLLGALTLFYTSWNDLPRYNIILLLCGFVMAVIWIMLAAGELVCLLKAVGDILSIPNAILGLTVLAWGNSLGDMVANVSIAKGGHARMAIAGCYAGPMFNMLIGQGISLVIVTVKNYPEPFDVHGKHAKNDWITPMSFIFLFASLFTALISVTASRFVLWRWIAGLLMSLYFLFMLLCILGTLNVINLNGLDWDN